MSGSGKINYFAQNETSIFDPNMDFTYHDFPDDYDFSEFPFDDELGNHYFSDYNDGVPDMGIPNSTNAYFNQEIDLQVLQNTEINPMNPQPKQRKKRTDLTSKMNASQISFMENYYKLIRGSKKQKVKKELIIHRYHPLVLQKLNNPTIPDTNRDEYRSIKLYFIHFANYESSILKAIKELIKKDMINYKRDVKEYKDSKKKWYAKTMLQVSLARPMIHRYKEIEITS